MGTKKKEKKGSKTFKHPALTETLENIRKMKKPINIHKGRQS
jgi:hypothetical protein